MCRGPALGLDGGPGGFLHRRGELILGQAFGTFQAIGVCLPNILWFYRKSKRKATILRVP